MENMGSRQEWTRARDSLVRDIVALGFSAELGEVIAKQPGSSKAMQRMSTYLYNVKLKSEALIVAGMLQCQK